MKHLLLILQILPALIRAIKAIEEEIPAPQVGSEKLSILQTVVDEVAHVSTDAHGTPLEEVAAIKPVLKPIVSSIVSVFNRLNIFRRTGSA